MIFEWTYFLDCSKILFFFAKFAKRDLFKNFEGFPECRTWKLANNVEDICQRTQNGKKKHNDAFSRASYLIAKTIIVSRSQATQSPTHVKTKN